MAMDIDIGIPPEQRKEIADGLSRLLADTYTLYLKTHSYISHRQRRRRSTDLRPAHATHANRREDRVDA